jgi:hypothetical protein
MKYLINSNLTWQIGLYLFCFLFTNLLYAKYTPEVKLPGSASAILVPAISKATNEPASASRTLANSFTYTNVATITTFSCPPDLIVNCLSEEPPYADIAAFIAAGGTANTDCGVFTSFGFSETSDGMCQPETISRTYTATDCNDTETCIQVITVNDNLTPITASCQGITVSYDNLGVASWTSADIDDGSSVGCVLSVTPNTYTCNNMATNPVCSDLNTSIVVTLTVTDCASSATSTCTATVSITDLLPPVITCPVDLTINCVESTLPGNTGTATATDNSSSFCSNVPLPAITYTDVVSGSCPGVETITRTWTATDLCSNTATCDQIITLEPPLPVELIDFEVKLVETGLELFWTTASETNNKGFEVQRSGNSQNWEVLGFIDGKGTSSTIIEYIHLDNNPLTGSNYYRLKQIDWDGAFEYSPIKVGLWQINSDKDRRQLAISPNPASTDITVKLPNYFNTNNDLILQIYDFHGRLILKEPRNGNDLHIDLANLPDGGYMLSIRQGPLQKSAPFIKR